MKKLQPIKIQFTGISIDADYSAGNELASFPDRYIVAYCPAPDDASEMYGYLTLKRAIISDLEAHGYSADNITWHWESADIDLPADASADCDVTLDIDYDYLDEVIDDDDTPDDIKYTGTFENGVHTLRRRDD